MRTVFILIVILLSCYFLYSKVIDKPTGEQIEINSEGGLTGLYEQYDQNITSGLLGLRFLNNSQVEMLADNKKLGDTVNYTIENNLITIQHACGVWYLDINNNNLFLKEDNIYFIKK